MSKLHSVVSVAIFAGSFLTAPLHAQKRTVKMDCKVTGLRMKEQEELLCLGMRVEFAKASGTRLWAKGFAGTYDTIRLDGYAIYVAPDDPDNTVADGYAVRLNLSLGPNYTSSDKLVCGWLQMESCARSLKVFYEEALKSK